MALNSAGNEGGDNVQKRGAPDEVPAMPIGVENNARRFRSKWDLLTDAERTRLEHMPFRGTCAGCETPLMTEADFARHFHVPDERFTNIGYCPETERCKRMIGDEA